MTTAGLHLWDKINKNWIKLESNHAGKLPVALEKSAFGHLLVDEESPIIQYSFEMTVDNTELFAQTLVNTGTITKSSSMAKISTGTTSASTAHFTSIKDVSYQAGQGFADSRVSILISLFFF